LEATSGWYSVEWGMKVQTQTGRFTESKARLLDNNKAGYAYSFDRQMYVNRKTKKVFSIEFIQDHDEDQIRKRIEARNAGRDWQFNFKGKLAESVRRELELLLG
jgi:hypothetical protein